MLCWQVWEEIDGRGLVGAIEQWYYMHKVGVEPASLCSNCEVSGMHSDRKVVPEHHDCGGEEVRILAKTLEDDRLGAPQRFSSVGLEEDTLESPHRVNKRGH